VSCQLLAPPPVPIQRRWMDLRACLEVSKRETFLALAPDGTACSKAPETKPNLSCLPLAVRIITCAVQRQAHVAVSLSVEGKTRSAVKGTNGRCTISKTPRPGASWDVTGRRARAATFRVRRQSHIAAVAGTDALCVP